jgi:hypothetical protein
METAQLHVQEGRAPLLVVLLLVKVVVSLGILDQTALNHALIPNMDPIVVQHVVPAALMGSVILLRVSASIVQLGSKDKIVQRNVLENGGKTAIKLVEGAIKACHVMFLLGPAVMAVIEDAHLLSA